MRQKLSLEESREALDIFTDLTLRMMVLSGALVAAREMEHGWWCVQFEGDDPHDIDHTNAMMLAYGFRLGTTHYHDYRQKQREIAEIVAEDEATGGSE